jgi:hypothetical protein
MGLFTSEKTWSKIPIDQPCLAYSSLCNALGSGDVPAVVMRSPFMPSWDRGDVSEYGDRKLFPAVDYMSDELPALPGIDEEPAHPITFLPTPLHIRSIPIAEHPGRKLWGYGRMSWSLLSR